jgi:hypothetical protein
MAVPTITTVSPATGPAAGGNIVTITGTNFKIPVLAYSVPQAALAPTVQVLVNGRAARRVDAMSSTQLRVLIPRLWHVDPRVDAFSPVNIVVSNIDSDGDVIPGETVTKTAAYTYARWDLGAPAKTPPLDRLAQELMWALKIEIEKQTYRTVHVDYGEEGSAVVIDLAKVPSINITLSTPADPEYGASDNYPEEILQADGITYHNYEGARTHMIVFDLYLTGEGTSEAMALSAAVEEFVQINPMLQVLADPDLYPGEEDEYPVEISQDAAPVTAPNDSTVSTFSMQLRMRGIAVLPGHPTSITKAINTFKHVLTNMDAENLTVRTL